MSVRAYETQDGKRWQVQWRDAQKKLRGKTFTSKSEAQAFDADVKAKKFKGDALPRASRQTLAQAYDDWLRLLGSQLAPSTQRGYQALWNAHVKGKFDGHSLTALVNDPQLFDELVAEIRDRGAGPSTQRKVLIVISSVLSAAVKWNKISTNPLWQVSKPSAAPQRYPRPLPPLVIERIRRRLYRRKVRDEMDPRGTYDALLVGLMAYAGLRPGEALALTWENLGATNLQIERAVSEGAIGPTKTRHIRTVPLPSIVSNEIATLRLNRAFATSTGRQEPKVTDLVFPGHDGKPWSVTAMRNWRNRVWKPAVKGLAQARPYDCRHSFVSLHLRAGASPLEVAKWAGHSPSVMFNHYANVIDELAGEPVLPVEEQISRAREMVMREDAESLDRLVDDLAEHPQVSDGTAALHLYAPDPEAELARRRGPTLSDLVDH